MTQQEIPRVRASDAEREQVVAALRHAMSEGRLILAEGEQRMAAAYAAVFRDELPVLTADLPPYEPTGEGTTGRADKAGERHRGRAGHGGPGPWGPGWFRHRRPRLAALTGVAALVLLGLALLADAPLWPAIVLGVATVVLLKHHYHGHPHHHGHRPACGPPGGHTGGDRRPAGADPGQ